MSVQTLSNTSIVVQRPSQVQDTDGGLVYVYGTIGTMKARVQPLSVSEIALAAKYDARITHRIYIDGVPDIKADDRIKPVTTGGSPHEDPDRSLYVRGVRDMDLLGRFVTIDAEDRRDV